MGIYDTTEVGQNARISRIEKCLKLNDDNPFNDACNGVIGGGPIGPEGPMGPRGPQGIRGPVGPKGDKGDRGDRGLTGEMGPIGREGPQGSPGIRGDTGAPGATGPQGPEGPQGPQGIQGVKGKPGKDGRDGVDGKSVQIQGSDTIDNILSRTGMIHGDMWIATDTNTTASIPGSIGDGYVWTGAEWDNIGRISGEKGEKGDKGDTGLTGATGPKGDKGDKGDAGATGPQGNVGPRGPKGDVGPKGDHGDKGDQGDRGDKGDKGDPGIDGKDGVFDPSNLVDNLVSHAADKALSANQGRILNEKIYELNKKLVGVLYSDGSVQMDPGYLPIEDQDILTNKFLKEDILRKASVHLINPVKIKNMKEDSISGKKYWHILDGDNGTKSNVTMNRGFGNDDDIKKFKFIIPETTTYDIYWAMSLEMPESSTLAVQIYIDSGSGPRPYSYSDHEIHTADSYTGSRTKGLPYTVSGSWTTIIDLNKGDIVTMEIRLIKNNSDNKIQNPNDIEIKRVTLRVEKE